MILAISIVLWSLTYFPRHDQEVQTSMANVQTNETANSEGVQKTEDEQKAETEKAVSESLQNSYAGQLGHLIEPVIQPLGFDWKIGVALIASFAAREVLVSTLSIIYSGDKEGNEESQTLISSIKD